MNKSRWKQSEELTRGEETEIGNVCIGGADGDETAGMAVLRTSAFASSASAMSADSEIWKGDVRSENEWVGGVGTLRYASRIKPTMDG